MQYDYFDDDRVVVRSYPCCQTDWSIQYAR